jgi:predicted nucleotidyltransferase
MAIPDVQLSRRHQNILERFLSACQADERVVAAFLIGSNAKGKADEHSDLDLYLVTTDAAFDDFDAGRESFAGLLGEPLFMEDFGSPNILFLIFADGSEVEIYYTSESRMGGFFNAPYKFLMDKKNITAGITSSETKVDQAQQTEKLRRLIHWFWHNLSHFITALERDQLWWARGQLEELRAGCVGLARLTNNFSDTEVEQEVYFKIEDAMPVDSLAPLRETFCPMEREAMLEAASVILNSYKELARPLAQAHEIAYPEKLEQVMVERLKKIGEDP